MAGEADRNISQTDDNSQNADHGGANVHVIISDSAAKWIVIVLLAFGVAYAVIGERTDHDTARDAQTEAMIAKNHFMELQADIKALETYGPPKEKTDAKPPVRR